MVPSCAEEYLLFLCVCTYTCMCVKRPMCWSESLQIDPLWFSKAETDRSLRAMQQRGNNIFRFRFTHSSSGNSNQERLLSLPKKKREKKGYHYLLEWLKFKTLTPPSADKDVEQQELSYIAGRNTKWNGHFGRQVGRLSQK